MSFNTARIKQDFNRAAARYDDYAGLHREVAERFINHIKLHLKPDIMMLDLGFGTGNVTKSLKNAKITPLQLDISTNMCKNSPFVPVINADMHKIPLVSTYFDLVTSSLALQWANDLEQIFAECYRILKPGGRLAFTTFGPQTLGELNSIFKLIDKESSVTNFKTKENIVSNLEKIGFNIELFDNNTYTRYYQNAHDLMRHIKGVGGAYKPAGNVSQLTRGEFTLIEKAYQQRFGGENSIPASWEVFTVIARRALLF